MKRSHWKMGAALLAFAALATPALAEVLQDPKPTPTGRTEEGKAADAVYDAQYRARRNNDTAPKADPWGGVRAPAAQPAAEAQKKTKN